MFSAEDLVFIEERGSDLNTVKEQVKNFENGFPFLEIIQAATFLNINLQKEFPC